MSKILVLVLACYALSMTAVSAQYDLNVVKSEVIFSNQYPDSDLDRGGFVPNTGDAGGMFGNSPAVRIYSYEYLSYQMELDPTSSTPAVGIAMSTSISPDLPESELEWGEPVILFEGYSDTEHSKRGSITTDLSKWIRFHKINSPDNGNDTRIKRFILGCK